MKCCARFWTLIGAILGGLAVVLGAMAAHGLDGHFVEIYANAEAKGVGGFEVPASWKYLQDFKTGAEYQMYHALALLAVGMLAQQRNRFSLWLAGWSFFLGIVLFSGSLYALTLTGQRWLGMVTPFGGVLFIVGWIALAVATIPRKSACEMTPSGSLNADADCPS